MHKVTEDLIDLIKTFQNHDAYYVNQILDAKSVFQKVYEDEKRKLPYSINLLDEIRADENAHSRILTKILQYVQNEKNVFLEKFLEYLKSPFADLIPVDPEITAEKDRVDILIRDENFTIIIENKIQGASDQAKQIERYICNEKNYGYKEEQIYIIYLTSDGGSPGEDSFSTDKRKDFKERL